MAHNVTERDGVFTVRQPAWWDLDGSHTLENYPTRAEAKAIAHPWEPITEPVFRRVPRIVTLPDGSQDVTEVYEQVNDFQSIARSDDGFLLDVAPVSRTVIRNDELYDIAEAIEGGAPEEVQYETGGSLLGGKKVWLMLRLREPLVVKNDPAGTVLAYYALQNSHDGSGSLRGQALFNRIVCDNTAIAADIDSQARGTEFVFRHTKNVRDKIEDAKAALAGWRESVVMWQRFTDHMVGVPITAVQRERFVTEFIPAPMPHVATERVMRNVETSRQVLRDILDGPTCANINLTGYGLVQAAIEYAQHGRKAHSQETAFKRAYLDKSRITTDAITLAKEVALS